MTEFEVNRRRLMGYAGAAALAGTMSPVLGAERGDAAPERSGHDQIPPATRPGGAYDRYVAGLAAQDKFSGVVLLAHRGRTVLSRSYGWADKEKRIRNHEDAAFNLSSAGGPFLPVAVLQLLQQGRLTLSDPVGAHLDGLAGDIAEQVSIHHLLAGTSGIDAPKPDVRRVFNSREEVHEYNRQWARQATLVAAPGSNGAANAHTAGGGAANAIAAQIVEAVTGTTFWDYMHEHVFGRAGMTGSAYYTRDQWLADEHIAHPYMRQPDGNRVDAVRNLDKDSLSLQGPGENPGRGFIGNVFATAPDLVRFAQAVRDATVLNRPYAGLYTGANRPGRQPTSFAAYSGVLHIVDGRQWVSGRGGGSGGVSANWNIYLDADWVGVVLSNYDDLEFTEILRQEQQAVTGQG
ncbi:beta-lactamase family protein [Nonomuraea sp. MG754425]|uniref:serine hydrolase domain-containing protein n=1 Tax=Nonomuraea sp. MG754425 TaxID=2570319 RepID=UPI001F41A7C0|nr:serine hydrolase domain-containing protein [Nonomuraea sp. MG754425]MCF6472484.1 beta-lactamase family protein [Nonomuraea sp. MG754425]